MTISNIQELKDFILKNNFTNEQINILLKNSLSILLVDEPKNKNQLIIALDSYWEKWGNYQYEKPLFLDLV